ncbi:hypothetical protein C8R47DRAFT_48997 [Mycena vitilis]|nr:hypothetical protein C8R47DRAFT_48997 [Mycena vitilis]
MLGWINPPLNEQQNDTSHKCGSILKRIHSRIFSPSSGTPTGNVAEEPPFAAAHPPQVEKEDKPAYSETESRQASAKLWSIYIGEAERYDKALVESWKADMEGMLIFSGLFSASLTAFLVESYQTLQPDTGAATVQLLTQISQQLAAPATNKPLASLDSSVYQPTTSSLVCNTLWFTSLTLSITCALLATLVEQWAREFLHRTEKHPSPIRRARVFSFLYFGVRRFGMHVVVDLIPLLLHVAMILFLAGLIAFLVPINEFLMGLIGAILVIFLAIYTVMTLLPIISSDCPYRTPFSGFVWRLIQDARKRWPGSASPAVTNLNDVMLARALQKSGRRDQRAISWTVDSLTDDGELLPFIEAIPEALFGPKGSYRHNDHMFISILNGLPNQESLGRRITDLLLNARNMENVNPLRHRSLTAGMKAIWALGMIAGRRGKLFTHGENFWFDVHTITANQTPDNPWGPRSDWPHSLEDSADFAIRYSQVHNIRSCITSLAHFAEAKLATYNMNDLDLRLKTLLIRFEELGNHTDPLHQILAPLMEMLEAWSSNKSGLGKDLSVIQDILRSMTKEDIWNGIDVALLTGFLLGAASSICKGYDLPYEYEKTCFEVVPRIPRVLDNVQIIVPKQPALVFSLLQNNIIKYLESSAFGADSSSNTTCLLDNVMSCVLRLFPLLKAQDVMPILVLYLGKRNSRGAIQVAFAHCKQHHLAYLLDCLVGMLDSTNEACILPAICITMIQGEYDGVVRVWHERDDQIYDLMTMRGIFDSAQCLCLSMLLKKRRLLHFFLFSRKLLHLVDLNKRHTPDSVELMGDGICSQHVRQRSHEKWRQLIAHPFLASGSPRENTISEHSTATQLVADISARVERSMIICWTEFILACPLAMDQPYLPDTMHAMCDPHFDSFCAVDAEIMVNFAKSWIVLVNHLVSDPRNVQLQTTVRLLFLDDLHAQFYYHPKAAPIYTEALMIYSKFLQDTSEQNDQLLKGAQMALDALASRMLQESSNNHP